MSFACLGVMKPKIISDDMVKMTFKREQRVISETKEFENEEPVAVHVIVTLVFPGEQKVEEKGI